MTALACKKPYPVYLDETADLFDVIAVSAGIRGLQILIAPADYMRVTNATLIAIAKEKSGGPDTSHRTTPPGPPLEGSGLFDQMIPILDRRMDATTHQHSHHCEFFHRPETQHICLESRAISASLSNAIPRGPFAVGQHEIRGISRV